MQRITPLINAEYATINFQKYSKDTAIRDINDLTGKVILQKKTAGGRSTNYELVEIKQKK